LSDKETFDSIISFQLINNSKKISDKSIENNLKTILNNDAKSYKAVLEKLNFYLDITETNIAKQVSAKADHFFRAVHSQDQVQQEVHHTCLLVQNIRNNIRYLDENVLLKSIRIIKYVNFMIKMKRTIQKVIRFVFSRII
jgi:hypothetical protein